ncbi:MAG: hypothetical protein Q9215_005919 [Flavoplaca cf. flavocitrina]
MHTPLIHLTALLSLLLSNSDLTTSYPLQPEIASHMEHTAKITPVTASLPAAHHASPQKPPSYLPTNPEENHPPYPEPPYPLQTAELAERGFGDWAKKKWNRFKDWLREPMKRSIQDPLEERTSGDLDQDLADLFEEATTSFDTATLSSNPSQQAKGKLVERGFREWLEKGFSWLWGAGPK